MATSQNKPISFGILTIPYQAIDIAGPLDLLSSSSENFISTLESIGVPGRAGLTAKSIPITFHHITDTQDLTPVALTSGFKIVPTTTCDECPELDYLLVGGPDPIKYQLSEKFAAFLKKHVKSGKVLFTTCTGSLCISATGILDGKEATTNHMMIGLARQMSPNVKWTSEKQWVVDGNIWTSGGVCAGMDMIFYWIGQTYGKELEDNACEVLDFEPRDVVGEKILRAKSGQGHV